MLIFTDSKAAVAYCRLTLRQQQYVEWIARWTYGHGYPPTCRDFAGGFSFCPNMAHMVFRLLARRGLMLPPAYPRAFRSARLAGVCWRPSGRLQIEPV